MTTSNRHPGTVARGLGRAFLLQAASGLLSALLAAPAPAVAQDVIQFSVGINTYPQYQVMDNDNGTVPPTLMPFPQVTDPFVHATTQSDYPGGRQYLYIPNGNLMVWSEGSGSKAVTNIQGPLSVSNGAGLCLWSNDGQASFVSFVLTNAAKQTYTYRAQVSAADITSASYQPITLGDPRLELVKDWQGNGGAQVGYWWNHDGSAFYYPDPSDRTKIRLNIVGISDGQVFVAPSGMNQLRVIPPVDPLNLDRYLVGTTSSGILAVDLVTSTSWWVATETGTGLSGIISSVFSPDGSHIAFGAIGGNKKTTYYGVYTVPLAGGPITFVTEVMGPKNTHLSVWVNNWNTP
jgi:hypothetical protein